MEEWRWREWKDCDISRRRKEEGVGGGNEANGQLVTVGGGK